MIVDAILPHYLIDKEGLLLAPFMKYSEDFLKKDHKKKPDINVLTRLLYCLTKAGLLNT